MMADLTLDCNTIRLKRKAKKQLGMGDFFKQIKIDKQKDGTVLIFERTLSPPKVTVSEINPKLKCKGCYKVGLRL